MNITIFLIPLIFILVYNLTLMYRRQSNKLTPLSIFLLIIPIIGVITSYGFSKVGASKLSSWTLTGSNIGFIIMVFLISKYRNFFYSQEPAVWQTKKLMMVIVSLVLLILLARFLVILAS